MKPMSSRGRWGEEPGLQSTQAQARPMAKSEYDGMSFIQQMLLHTRCKQGESLLPGPIFLLCTRKTWANCVANGKAQFL